MIQDISPHLFDNSYKDRKPEAGDRIFFYQGRSTLLSKATGLPFTYEEVDRLCPVETIPSVYLFSIDGRGYFWGRVMPKAVLSEGILVGDRHFRDMQPEWEAFSCITASQLHSFYHEHQFCGCCGAPALPDEKERAMRCPVCGKIVYPVISPAVIVGVTHGDRLLLTKYSRPGSVKFYALVAGYTEIGESLEDTVRREVMEEVGLRVKNIRFYKSQPWSFSGSLLSGFYCDLDGDDETVRLQEDELSEATWYDRSDLPEGGSSISLTHEMIERFRMGPV
mgnify:CR=1 FL=1